MTIYRHESGTGTERATIDRFSRKLRKPRLRIKKPYFWYSVDGINWQQAASQMELGPRFDHSSVVFDDRIWIIGGTAGNGKFADVWFSLDGISWIEAQSHDDSPWAARRGFVALVHPTEGFERMWIMGGAVPISAGIQSNEVWHDMRDHEVAPNNFVFGSDSYSNDSFPMTIQQPKRRQSAKTTSSSIVVDQHINISDVNIGMTIAAWDGQSNADLRVELSHEYTDGNGNAQEVRIALFQVGQLNGSNLVGFDDPEQNNFVPTTLDDEPISQVSILDGLSPYAGSFRPFESLQSLDEVDAHGVWTLEITDTARTGGGALYDWSLEISGLAFTPDPGGGTGNAETYSSDDTPNTIPDNNLGGVDSLITDVADFAPTVLTVTLNTDHPRPSDLEAYVTGPDGTQLQLFIVQGENDLTGLITDTEVDWLLEVFDTRKKKEGTLQS